MAGNNVIILDESFFVAKLVVIDIIKPTKELLMNIKQIFYVLYCKNRLSPNIIKDMKEISARSIESAKRMATKSMGNLAVIKVFDNNKELIAERVCEEWIVGRKVISKSIYDKIVKYFYSLFGWN